MTADATNEEYLARQAQLGNREAFMTLYNLYLNKVYYRVRSRVPPQDVEDVVQEIFIAVMRSMNGFELRSQFSTWLYTIVNRQIADFYRKRYRTIGGKNETIALDQVDRVASTPSTDRERMDEQALIQKALGTLPDHYQEIILSRFADGLTFAEIAKRRGQSLEAIKSLYRRALQAIRDQVGDA